MYHLENKRFTLGINLKGATSAKVVLLAPLEPYRPVLAAEAPQEDPAISTSEYLRLLEEFKLASLQNFAPNSKELGVDSHVYHLETFHSPCHIHKDLGDFDLPDRLQSRPYYPTPRILLDVHLIGISLGTHKSGRLDNDHINSMNHTLWILR
uniref:Uncharacterized protein n=1 Tax=Cannabis sativa TaxID=3483 RepID=A0A803P539_CANSA